MKLRVTIAWSQVSVEGLAIVASFLLAFAIDAWWGERERAETEHVVLQTERLGDILDTGHPGVDKHLLIATQMLEEALAR